MKSTDDHKQHIDIALKNLAKDNELQLEITGTCMEPAISEKSKVRISPQRTYWPGDILVIRSGDGRLLAHRLLGIYPYRGRVNYITQGDNVAIVDIAVRRSDIIGRVTSSDPGGMVITIPLLSRYKALWKFVRFIFKRLIDKFSS